MYKKHKSTLLLVCIALLMLLPGCAGRVQTALTPPEYVPRKVTYETEIIRKTSISDVEIKYGTVVPLIRKELSFQVSGYLKEFYVSGNMDVREGDLLGALENETLSTQLRDQGFQLQKAILTHEKERNEFAITGLNKDALLIAELDLKAAQFRYDRVKTQHDNLLLYAPMDFRVEFTTGLPGQFIHAGTSVMRVMDNSRQLVSIPMDATLDFLVVGSRLSFISHPDEYEGEVILIDPVKRLIFLEPATKLEKNLGTTVAVHIVLTSKEDVIVIPTSAVHEEAGRRYAYVLESGIRSEREIRTGLATASQVEVVFGLSEGDELILSVR
ncbi:MAG: hypothetical protein R6W96_07375 [Clostridia bacterium]